MKKPLNKFIQFSGIGLQIGVTIWLCSYIGEWLDIYFDTGGRYFKMGLVVVGFVLSMYSMIRQLNRMQND